MEKLLSIIIPTYNMEAYLGRCLDSLIVGGEMQDAMDVIVVNDGSKDRSSEIAHTYADKYPNSFRVIDKPNGNYGSCINAALPVATGKYVKVLDSDDYFDNEALAVFLEKLKDIDTDGVFTDYTREYSDTGEKVVMSLDYADGEIIVPDEKLLCDYEMHHLAYKTSLLRNMSYVQTEGISYTDTEWCFYPLFHTKAYTYLDINLYQYQLGRVGQTMDDEVFIEKIGDLDVILEKMLRKISGYSSDLSELRKNYCESYLVSRLKLVYSIELMRAKTTNEEVLRLIDDLLKKYSDDIYKDMAKPSIRRCYVSLFRCGLLLPRRGRVFLNFLASFL